jgi:uncharacterized oxidoreductase
MQLQGNTILITGGTSGFGFDFASKLLALGNTVIITGRNAQKLQDVKRALPGVHTFQSDVSNADEIVRLHERVAAGFPALNILINNAGEMRKIGLQEPRELPDLTREIDINLSGPIRMVQQFLPLLKSQPRAAIVNVTSGIALMPFAMSPVYSASKAGLRSYTQALRVQLKKTNVHVMELVAPGSSTPLNDKFTTEKNVSAAMMMAPGKIVDAALRGLQRDKPEVFPGLAKLMRIMSRVAPGFMIAQAGKMGS